jgi:gluconate:H+ symporter, GntP family
MTAVLVLLLFLLALTLVVGGILFLRIHAFLALLGAALLVTLLTPAGVVEQAARARGLSAHDAAALARTPAGERVGEGFGRTCGQIGVLIAMASIIGTALLESGGADRIVRSALRVLGPSRAPAAFLGSGFLLGIPVFFDTVFYMLVPLAKAARVRSGRQYLLYVLAIVAGGTMTHSLVPPTPGPLFVANAFGVSLALMTVGGCIVGGCAAAAGFTYARWADRRWPVPLRDAEPALAELERVAQTDDRQLPPLWLALMPIVLPIILITMQATIGSSAGASRWLSVVGEKNVAVGSGALVALIMLGGAVSGTRVRDAVTTALTSAGVIILITAAGGAFGAALQQTGLGAVVQQLVARYELPVLPLAFVLTALLRTALGSATVAMITASGAFAGLATGGNLPFHPMYIALAIGCGSKPIWWMNDSGFWVVTQMSGLTEREGLRHLTPMSILMGVTGLLATMAGAELFPLV